MQLSFGTRNSALKICNSYGIHYGWVMVALAFLSALFATASVGVPNVLIVPMSNDLGWSIGEIGAPIWLRLALFELSAPFAGGLMTVGAGVSRDFIGSYVTSFLFAGITCFMVVASLYFVKK